MKTLIKLVAAKELSAILLSCTRQDAKISGSLTTNFKVS